MLCESVVGVLAGLLAAEYQKRYQQRRGTAAAGLDANAGHGGHKERLSRNGAIVFRRRERPS